MKNKFFLPIFLLFAVNNFQCTAERVITITAREFSDLFCINELKKKLKLLEGKPQRTRSDNEIIASFKTCIARYDEKIEDKITELKKDKEKNGHKIKILEGLTSEKVNDELVEEAKKGLLRYENRFPAIIRLGACIGGAIGCLVNLLKNNKI